MAKGDIVKRKKVPSSRHNKQLIPLTIHVVEVKNMKNKKTHRRDYNNKICTPYLKSLFIINFSLSTDIDIFQY